VGAFLADATNSGFDLGSPAVLGASGVFFVALVAIVRWWILDLIGQRDRCQTRYDTLEDTVRGEITPLIERAIASLRADADLMLRLEAEKAAEARRADRAELERDRGTR